MRHVKSIVGLLVLCGLLAGCETAGLAGAKFGEAADPAATGSVGKAEAAGAVPVGLSGDLPADPVNVGKRHFREGHYGLAEKAFRTAVETSPRDAEAWVGLAASYDRLRRFDLADRAYAQAIKLVGATPVILNNQGYSYLLRGDLKKARAKLNAALARDPENPIVRANVEALVTTQSLGKDVR